MSLKPRKKRGIREKRADIPPLDATIMEYLVSGEVTRGTPGWFLYTSRFFDNWELIGVTREYYADQIEAEKKRRKRNGNT